MASQPLLTRHSPFESVLEDSVNPMYSTFFDVEKAGH
jgi:hypothetical protein